MRITQAEFNLAIAALDGVLSAVEFFSRKIAEGKKEGLVTTPEQEAILKRAEDHAKAVGF